MKAYSLNGINNLQYVDFAMPKAESGWVVVQVGAAGICSSDIPRIFTKGTYHFPTVPGHEFSGRVFETHEDDKKYLGKKVGIFPLIPCKKCEACKRKHYEMCSNYDYLGSRRDGGFAEFVKVPVWNLIEVDENVPFTTIAMMEPLSVALHSVKIADICNTDKVAIIGTGMIGIACAQWASKITNDVTVIGRNNTKKKIIDKIPNILYSTENDYHNEFDVVIEAVGSNLSINLGLEIVKPGGKVVLMGNPEGDMLLPQNTYWKILRKQLKILGTWNSAYDGMNPSDWIDVKNAIEKGKIFVEPLITHFYSKEELKNGLNLMSNHKEPYCKVMTRWLKDE